ncbi:MAG: helix-turn-helix transcriptional regulator [Gemmatimonadaceae bacterium]|nr:helix-turn-helix transcriptional regulator [Gemmatimonadaceae bacterium]
MTVVSQLVELFDKLGFSVVVRDPDTAEVIGASDDGESQLLAADPAAVRVASAKVAGAVVRVEIVRTELEEPAALTPRQRAVARLLVAGKPNTVIAEELKISTHTVRRHLESIFRRLHVQNRTAAAAELRKGTIKL